MSAFLMPDLLEWQAAFREFRHQGDWDCNPATLMPLPERESAPLYVERVGGSAKMIAKARQLHNEGKYLLAQEILNKLVHAEPGNTEAKDWLADVFEQIGHQQEHLGLRNSFLAGASELRSGIPQGTSPKSTGPDVIRAMTTELFLNFLGSRMDSRKAEGLRFTLNLLTPDNGEMFVVELENAMLTNLPGFLADSPDLEKAMTGQKSIQALFKDGTAKAEVDLSILAKLAATMVEFNPQYQILPGTGEQAAVARPADPFKAVPQYENAE